MTKDLYLNILYSIRYFLHEIPGLNIPWYFTQNIPFTDDSFVETAGAMMDFSQETNEWNSFANLNVYSKTQVNEITAAIADGLKNMYITVYDFVNSQPTLVVEHIEIERIVTTALGQLDSGHAVNNISVYYKILTR